MAASSSSSLLLAHPASLRPNPRNLCGSAVYPSLSPFPIFSTPRSPARRRLLSRRSCEVRATTLREKDEKVNVEDSFPAAPGLPHEGMVDDAAGISDRKQGEVERWVIKFEQSVNVFLTESVIKILDSVYHDRDYARFFVLETIARVPYFAFISVLHMYESFGWWRRADYIKVHFAESWNELHHLLIMEELGGNSFWLDRFLAQHIATFYYFMTVIMYIISPRMAYHFSECVERHAYSTYDKFVKLQEENLYDVFVNIRDDEAEHCKTMKTCQTHGKLRSPHSDLNPDEDAMDCAAPQADCEGILDCVKKSLTSRR